MCPRRCPVLLLALLAIAPACPRGEPVLVLWAAAEVKGTIAPCGCTTDPLGGLDKVAALVRSERYPHGLVCAGPLDRALDDAEPPEKRLEADAKATLLDQTFAQLGGLAAGMHEVGGARVAILPVAAGEVPRRPPGAQVALALMNMTGREARRALKEAQGIDLAVVGRDIGAGEATPEHVGQTWLVTPADELQGLVRLELHLRGGGPAGLAYAGGPQEPGRLAERIRQLDEQLRKWRSAPDADRAFVAAREAELVDLRAELAQREKHGGLEIPPSGAWFTSTRVAVKQSLPSDAGVRQAMKALAERVGQANRARDCGQPAPPRIEPHYVGMARCGDAGCHPKAVALWRNTVHAHAWKTLLDDGRAFSLECFGCHTTGFGEPGRAGARLCRPEPLTDVQCEVCHGPASKHVEAQGLEEPAAVTRRPDVELCRTRCHTPKHSDTFDRTAYMRDILGEGHGAKLRAELGPGPTGHELRQAALQKAGRAP